MTHDELLAEIDERTSYLGNTDGIYTALRAVVESHKPYLFAIDEIKCLDCQFYYPCPTIQAIEKGLG